MFGIAAAALLFPIAITAAEAGGHDPRPFALALAMAASAGFATPIAEPVGLRAPATATSTGEPALGVSHPPPLADADFDEQVMDPAVTVLMGRERIDNGDGTWSWVSDSEIALGT